MEIPKPGKALNEDQLELLKIFSKSCRKSILEMVVSAQSGHPGGSLSSIDYLATLYAFIIGQTGEKIVISNGHISPAVYSVLAEMGYVSKEKAINTFRKFGSKFEGHVTRHVPGIHFGTGPLGIGVSIASSFALAEKLKNKNEKIFGLMGDGEAQEGQVHEMIHFSHHYNLDNLILFVDYNKVQLTASLEEIQNIDLQKLFEAGNWHVINIDAHNFSDIWAGLGEAYQIKNQPVVILGHSIMGKNVPSMEEEGNNKKSTWHGKAPKEEEIKNDIIHLALNENEEKLLEEFRKGILWHPEENIFTPSLSKVEVNSGTPILYTADTPTDNRTAYGKALADLAEKNQNILALTADLRGSVMTKFVDEKVPTQHIECGIAEQHMVSLSGGLSLSGFIPFCSTFGAFMSSRAKDQARVNDINQTNVKMVATHCGLSVGEDGPTHQAIDDAGSFLGIFNTMVIDPADPNHTDRIIRYIASHYGNFYVRMGRHKIPTILKKDGTPFYDENYIYEYGKCDLIHEGNSVTIAAIGSMVNEALKAHELLKVSHPEISVEIIAVSSIKKFDNTLFDSIKKTGKILTVEDHNPHSGLGSQISKTLIENNIKFSSLKMLGVTHYELSGKVEELYESAGISPHHIKNACLNLLT